MGQDSNQSYIAFAGSTRLATGDLQQVAMEARALIERSGHDMIIIFDANTSHPMDVDFRDPLPQVPGPTRATGAQASKASLHLTTATDTAPATTSEGASPNPTRRSPGRPKLGVVAREVTLFPRHWDWLSRQPGGASATLRRLVEEARRSTADEVRVREARESCYRFMTAMAGNEPGYEEAVRALFAGNCERFQEETAQWPADVRDHARGLAERSC